MNDIDVPDDRPIPTDVLNRLDETLTLGIDAPAPRRRGRTLWLAAAAAVVVLLGAAIVFSTQGEGTRTAADRAKMAAALDHCWSTVQSQGRAAKFPNRSSWRSVFQVVSPSVTVTAIRVAGKPVFCEDSLLNTTVTDPDAPPTAVGGSRTAILLDSPMGTVAGVADPTWHKVHVSMDLFLPHGDDPASGDATTQDGLFVYAPASAYGVYGLVNSAPARVTNGSNPAATPVRVPWPPVDWMTVKHGTFKDCLALFPSSNPDVRTSWTAGASVASTDDRFHMTTAVNAEGDVAACTWGAGISPVFTITDRGRPERIRIRPDMICMFTINSDPVPVLAGRVHPTTTRLELVLPNGTTVTTPIDRTTFAVRVPGLTRANLNKIVGRAYNAKNELVYEGLV